MNRFAAILVLGLAAAGLWFPAAAQDATPEKIPFEGGAFTITETADLDKQLAFDGQLLASNFVVSFDKIIELRDVKVALFSIGDGGNQCGASTLIAFKAPDGTMDSDFVGEGDCGAPPAAATGEMLYFVPYLLPGATAKVWAWSPRQHLHVAGMLSFMPQPGSVWAELDGAGVDNMIDTFSNEAVYDAAKALLGDKMTDVATGLSVGGGAETLPSGVFFSSGCVPHACGSADAFMAIDAKGQKLYFAQQGEQGKTDTWPAAENWPADVRDAMVKALSPPQ